MLSTCSINLSILESTLQVETTLENLAELMQKITEIQIITEKVR